MPRIGGLNSGDSALADENEDAVQEFSTASCQRFNILCSGGKDGCICFSIFGIFPVGKIVSKYENLVLYRHLNLIMVYRSFKLSSDCEVPSPGYLCT
jgi:hypothetical protein